MKPTAATRIRRLIHSFSHESAGRILFFLFKVRLFGEGSGVIDIRHSKLEENEIINPVLADQPNEFGNFPKLIFQTWKSRFDIPPNYRYWRQTFVDQNPSYDVLLWDDTDNRSFVAAKFPWFLGIYDSYPAEIFRADAVRVFFLFACGGYYADMDTECLMPIETHVNGGDVVLGRMGFDEGFDHSIPNAIMASKPEQAFWLLAIHLMTERIRVKANILAVELAGPEAMTGPILIKDTADLYLRSDRAALQKMLEPLMALLAPEQRARVRYGTLTILSQDIWYPIDWTNIAHKALRNYLRTNQYLLPPRISKMLFPRSSLVTFWSHSWPKT